MRLTVRVTRAGGRVRGELRVNEAGGEAETRRVDGATCAEVVQVLSLTAALAIDPTADLLAPAPPEKPGATPAPVRAPPSATAAPPSGRAPAAAAAAPVAASPSRATTGRAASGHFIRGGRGAGVAAASGASSSRGAARRRARLPCRRPRSRPRRRRRRRSSAQPSARTAARRAARGSAPRWSAARVLTSSVGLGASLWGRLGTTTRGGLTPSVTLAALYLPGDFFGSGDNLGIGWMALGRHRLSGLGARRPRPGRALRPDHRRASSRRPIIPSTPRARSSAGGAAPAPWFA